MAIRKVKGQQKEVSFSEGAEKLYEEKNLLETPTNQKTYNVGNQQVSKEEYNALKAMAGFSSGGAGKVTSRVNEIAAQNPQLLNPSAALTTSNLNAPTEAPFVKAEPLKEDIKPAGLDALDVGKVIGAGTAGAATGAGIGAGIGGVLAPVTGGLSVPVGAAAGGVIGGIGGAATALFYSSASERRQQTKVSFNNFKDATTQMDNIIKDVNSGHMSRAQAMEYWDNEIARVDQSERELKMQQDALFGEKLSKSMDELAKIEAWRRRLPLLEFEFQTAMTAPDPSRVIPNYGVVDSGTTEEGQ